MMATPLRSALASWRADAPWPEWTWRRGIAVGLVLGTSALVTTGAFVTAVDVSWCRLFGGQCSPEENRQLAVAGAFYYGGLVVFVLTTVGVFVLRRRLFWLTPGLLIASTLVSSLLS